MIWRAWCVPWTQWNFLHSLAVSGPRIGCSAIDLPRPYWLSQAAISLSMRSIFSKISVVSCAMGAPRGKARSGDLRPEGRYPSQMRTRRCQRLLLRSMVAPDFPALRQRSQFLTVPRYVWFKWSNISAELHFPSGCRAKSSTVIPWIAFANWSRKSDSFEVTSSRMLCSNCSCKISS